MRQDPFLRRTTLALALAGASVNAWCQSAQRIEITGSAEPQAATSALRAPVAVDKTPQSVSVLTRELLDEQGVQTLTEALRNVSAVRGTDARDLFNFGLRIRGFEAGVLVDGVALPGQFTTPDSLAGVARVEVVKGPAGTLYGGSQSAGNAGFVGGLVAVSTAAPQSQAQRSVQLRLGTQGERRLGFDVNQPLDARWSLRLQGDIGQADSETDLLTQDRQAWQAGLAWRPAAGSELVVRLRHSGTTGRDYAGLPRQGSTEPAAYSVPRSRILTADGLPDSKADTDSLNVQWTQPLSADWTLNLLLARVQARMDQPGTFALDSTTFAWPSNDGPFYFLSGARLWNRVTSTLLSPSVTGRFQAAGARHTMVAGLDLDRTRDDAYLRFSPGFGLLGLVDITNPVYPAWAEPDTTGTPDQRNRYRSTAAYVQEHADFGSLQLSGSLRHQQVKVEDVNPAFGVDNRSTNRKTLLRAGAVLPIGSMLSAFAGWGQGMRVPTFAIFSAPPKPELSTQSEIGLRVTGVPGLSASLALFDLKLKNALMPDPAHPGQTVQVGSKRSRGVDAELQWQVTPGWHLLASLTQQNPKVQDTGKQAVDMPRTSARLATRHELPGGFGVGLGLTHHSTLPGDASNSYFTPAATLFDAQLSWKLQRVTLGLVAQNLADKRYYTPSRYFGGGQVTPAPRRTVAATARVDF